MSNKDKQIDQETDSGELRMQCESMLQVKLGSPDIAYSEKQRDANKIGVYDASS